MHRRKDGSEFPAEIVTTYVQFGGKEFACGFARDISEKKQLEEQLRQAQKMEAVGTLAGGVAHDFNNILTVIMGLGNLIQMSIDKDDLIRPHVDQIVASSEKAADLTQSLLAFSRKQRITLEAHKVNGVVTSTAKLLTRLLPEDIRLTVNLDDEDTVSLLDVTQIGQVLMNLATNGRDAMPHGGSLAITTGRATIDENFKKTHGFGRRGDYVRLSVSDTGTGMDEPTMERIFEPFFTTKEIGKGTGLGLASAYGIVKQHNGYITVSSAPFKGTTFDIYLPLIDTPSPQEAPTTREIKGGAETILIVEDDRDVRHMLTEILESHGYTTMEAIDGDDAIRVHHAYKEKVDLIILDVVMPGKNGKETLDEITCADPRVKAVFVSGYTGDVVIDKGIQRESVDFLHKPVSVTALLAKVREVLDR
jgi:nitrogen-specific signal transduction histidine kinase/ActR/RegA family two-component response regulator